MQKTNFKTRLLALLTAVFMVIVSMPFAAFAADEGGTNVIPNEISVSFNCWDATVVSEGADQSGDHYATYKLNSKSEYKNLPTLKDVPEDKEFKGWFIDGTDVEVVATTFSFDSLKAYAQNDSHAVSISAKLVDKEAEEINVSFNCWDATVVSEGADQSGDHYATYKLKATSEFKSLPTLKDVPENKEFKGWFIDGTDVEVVDTTFNFDSLKAYAQNASHAVSISAKLVDKEPEVAYDKISVSFLNDNHGSIVTAETISAGKSVTAPTKDGDKNIVGWTIGGVAYTGNWSYESLNALVTEDNINNLYKTAYIEAYAVYEEEKPEADSVKNIIVTIGEGETWADGFDESNTRTWSAHSDQADVKSVKLPVSAKAGKEFVEWVKVGEETVKLEAGKAYSYNDLEDLGITECGDIAFKAVYKDVVATTTQKNIVFMLGEGNTWADNFDNSIVSRTWTAYSDTADVKSVMPPVVAKEGKEFVEWVKVGEESVKLAAGEAYSYNDLKELGVPEDGDIAFVPVFKDKEAIAKNVIFQVSEVEGAKWATKDDQEAYGQNSRYYQTWSNDAGKYTAPAAAKDGKDFDYWVCNYGDKKIVIRAGEEFNFDTLTAKGISATEAGDFAFNPVFKDKASSSSSSSSSSSNKTTTASNEKQVVKAAAAPANTTKVLPKTGASNVAPLLGGSLAVVALLMGYGVYGLVLRKKD